MEKQEDTSFWLKFFKEAGLPAKTGASYAHIFIENRIYRNMLSDLTVDYLRLMGITLMGDIIAILRHSKSVHQDSLRKVVILKSKEAPPGRIKSSSSSSSESSSSDEDVRVVEITKPHHRKMPSSTISSKSSNHTNKGESSQTVDTKQVRSKVIGKPTSLRPAATKRISSNENQTSAEPVKRKHDVSMDVDAEPTPIKSTTTSTSMSNSNSGRSILKSPPVSAKKVRVTAENKLMGPKLPPPKKTVFDRLGSETSSPLVSSTTVELIKPETVETRFTRVISSNPIIDNTSAKMSSVFDRLGGLDSSPEVKPPGPVLRYGGVLKSPTPVVNKSPVNLLNKVGTMRADEPEVPVKLRAAKPVKSLKILLGETLLRKRLGSQQRLHKPTQVRGRLASTPSEGIFANPIVSKATKSVKQRLGSSLSSGRPRNNNLMRVRGPPFSGVQRRSNYGGIREDNGERAYTFSSRVAGKDLKRVSFGNVEQKMFSSVSPMYSSREPNAKVSIHRRLGAVRYK